VIKIKVIATQWWHFYTATALLHIDSIATHRWLFYTATALIHSDSMDIQRQHGYTAIAWIHSDSMDTQRQHGYTAIATAWLHTDKNVTKGHNGYTALNYIGPTPPIYPIHTSSLVNKRYRFLYFTRIIDYTCHKAFLTHILSLISISKIYPYYNFLVPI
jgi:hypothetical protein